ncbi:MAG TPA: hypothetical protein DDX54_03945 [Rhodospirillaceae bacterium]|jgi:hypothetical protein|nr:hypothetical protein [Alphaproteobacteria bacterium]HBH26536.1 hypothetical protein [Rhodospirillaceae bacterium]
MTYTERQAALAHAEDLETLLGAAHKRLNSNPSSGYDLAHLILRLVPKARNALRQLGGAV